MAYVTTDLAVSVDGFAAGRNLTLDRPFGDAPADQLHRWMFETPDENAAITQADAFIMGRNMFSPGRGDWDLEWTGWWGEDPPYHKLALEQVSARAASLVTHVTYKIAGRQPS